MKITIVFIVGKSFTKIDSAEEHFEKCKDEIAGTEAIVDWNFIGNTKMISMYNNEFLKIRSIINNYYQKIKLKLDNSFFFELKYLNLGDDCPLLPFFGFPIKSFPYSSERVYDYLKPLFKEYEGKTITKKDILTIQKKLIDDGYANLAGWS